MLQIFYLFIYLFKFLACLTEDKTTLPQKSHPISLFFPSPEHREQAELRVPASVTLEVVPASMQAWCRVQGLAHNPRIRLNTSLQRPLTALISHLQEKWRNSNLKMVSFFYQAAAECVFT